MRESNHISPTPTYLKSLNHPNW